MCCDPRKTLRGCSSLLGRSRRRDEAGLKVKVATVSESVGFIVQLISNEKESY